jgi:signal transduction histidine kinase
VQDDGVGFDRAATATGVGLLSMHERATLIGGTLTITTAPGQGTAVMLCIPHPALLERAKGDDLDPHERP